MQERENESLRSEQVREEYHGDWMRVCAVSSIFVYIVLCRVAGKIWIYGAYKTENLTYWMI